MTPPIFLQLASRCSLFDIADIISRPYIYNNKINRDVPFKGCLKGPCLFGGASCRPDGSSQGASSAGHGAVVVVGRLD